MHQNILNCLTCHKYILLNLQEDQQYQVGPKKESRGIKTGQIVTKTEKNTDHLPEVQGDLWVQVSH